MIGIVIALSMLALAVWALTRKAPAPPPSPLPPIEKLVPELSSDPASTYASEKIEEVAPPVVAKPPTVVAELPTVEVIEVLPEPTAGIPAEFVQVFPTHTVTSLTADILAGKIRAEAAIAILLKQRDPTLVFVVPKTMHALRMTEANIDLALTNGAVKLLLLGKAQTRTEALALALAIARGKVELPPITISESINWAGVRALQTLNIPDWYHTNGLQAWVGFDRGFPA